MPNKNKNKDIAPQIPEGLVTRSLHMVPNSYREQDNSVEFTLCTEDPTYVWDWKRWDVIRETLVSGGFELYTGDQVPLLDTHNRYSVENILGSVRHIRTEGDRVVGRLFFSDTDEAKKALQKIKEGHLTAGSVGYNQNSSTLIEKGGRAIIDGKEYEAGDAEDLLVTTNWTLLEFSLVPIPANKNATVREKSSNPAVQNFDNGTKAEKEKKEMPTKTDNAAEIAAKGQEKAPVQSASVQPAIDVEAAKAEAVKAEQERAAKITDLCTRHGCTGLQTELIRSGASIEAAQDKVLSAIETRASLSVAAKPTLEIGKEESEKYRDAVTDGVLLRAGLNIGAQVAEGAQQMRAVDLSSIARHCLERSGVDTRYMGKTEIVTRALSTSDFPNILDNIANKALLIGYKSGRSTWRTWAKAGSVSDFKTNTRVRLTDAPELLLNLPGEEIQQGVVGDNGEPITLKTYARRLIINRQALINDDIGLFNTLFAAFGARAANQIEATVYADGLKVDHKMSDGKNLFNTDTHKNAASAGTTIDATSVAAGIAAMGNQKAESGLVLDIRPAYLLCGIAKKVQAELLCGSTMYPVATYNADINPLKSVLEPVATAHIPGNKWFLTADKNAIDTVEVAFLDGKDQPTMYQDENQNAILGRSFTAFIDYAVKALEWRGMYYNSGA